MAVHHSGLTPNEEMQLINNSMSRCDPWEINRLMTTGQTIQQYATELVGTAMGNERLKMGVRLKAVALTIRMGQQNLLRQKIVNDAGVDMVVDRETIIVLPSNGSERIVIEAIASEPVPEEIVPEYQDAVLDAAAEPTDDESAGVQQFDAIGGGWEPEWFGTDTQ